jgi:hypothetical protein
MTAALTPTSGEATVGVIHRAHGAPSAFWLWSITHFHVHPMQLGPGHGSADTLEEAMRQFAKRWRRWLAWAELTERG